MTQIEIQKYNKRCAEFLRYKVITNKPYIGAITVQEGCDNPSFLHDRMEGESWYVYPRFDSNWNWIMEVVEKIEKLGFTFIIDDCHCYFYKDSINKAKAGFGNTKKEAVVQAIDKFLIWYKTNS